MSHHKNTVQTIWAIICMYIADWLFFLYRDPTVYRRWVDFEVVGSNTLPTRPHVLVIYCHPSSDSHNHQILQRVKRGLGDNELEPTWEVLDLYSTKFNPVMGMDEHDAQKNRSHVEFEDVKRAQEAIARSTHLVFIYPTWWYGEPAMLKGFLDRVFANGFAYRMVRLTPVLMLISYIVALIPGIRYLLQPYTAWGHLRAHQAFVFRTLGGPSSGAAVFNNTERHLEEVVLRFCGLSNITVRELHNLDNAFYSSEVEKEYLEDVELLCKELQ